jgi:hypothetical protein
MLTVMPTRMNQRQYYAGRFLKRAQDRKYSSTRDFYRPDSYRVKGWGSLICS